MEQQVHRIVCSAVEQIDGTAFSDGTPVPKWTPSAKLALTKLVLIQLDTLVLDLEAFSKHGKRTTITNDDVRLALRKNPDLLATLNAQIQASSAPKEAQ